MYKTRTDDEWRERLTKTHVKVDAETGCLLWTGDMGPSGYGRVRYKNRDTSAHRMDMFAKRRAATKLTPEKVKEMRSMHSTGQYTYAKLGVLFGVSRDSASRAIRGAGWWYVPDGLLGAKIATEGR